MKHTEQALSQGAAEQARWPIGWSHGRRQMLRDTADGRIAGHSNLDPALSASLLRCADGDFAAAEREITALLRAHLGECRDEQVFISLLNAVFTVQRFDLTAAMLRDRHGYRRPLEVAGSADGPGFGRILWDVQPSGVHRFTFDAASWRDDETRNDILGFQWSFPLYAQYAEQPFQKVGAVVINQKDVGITPGLAWCDNRPDYFLVPDCIFVPSRGYAWAREVLAERAVPWDSRASAALWRGATTGIAASAREWRSLERVRLCEIGRRHAHTGLIDAGLSAIVQFGDADVVREITDSGLLRGPVRWEDWGGWKYLIDIDGNSSPWSNLFQRLLTGSAVLKVESPRALQQWFYDELEPWRNYVPVAPDMSDLMDKIGWLARNDSAARRIGEAGRALALRLTYEREVARGVNVIAAAFRRFNGQPEGVGPFGRDPS